MLISSLFSFTWVSRFSKSIKAERNESSVEEARVLELSPFFTVLDSFLSEENVALLLYIKQ